MKVPQARFVSLVLLVFFLSTVSLLLSSPEPKAGLVVQTPRASAPQAPLPRNLYADAAKALREGELQEARQHLDRISREHPDQAAQARVLDGLYEHVAGDEETAGELLAAAGTPGGPLEDWRLFLLARSASERGEGELARATYARLLAECPDSSLRPLAFLESAELAREAGADRLALELIDKAREAGIRGEAANRLDSLAWKIGRELEDPEVQREAGRRLMVEAPLSAEALEAVRTFRVFDTRVDWSHLLSAEDILRRAESFLDAGELPSAALSTLEGVPEDLRDFRWHLLKARALTEARRGLEALDVLSGVVPSALEERASLEWERALAAASAAETRSGLPSGERRKLLDLSHRHLVNVVRSHADASLSREALRELYDDFLEAGLIEPALDSLRALRKLDPHDGTGTSDLWEQGWAQYQSGNLSGAVGVWSEMEDIYPDHRETQRARYWKARALEDLGEPGRAREIYRDLVATSDTSDFYMRQAVARLGETPDWEGGVLLAAASAGPWPSDPALQRVKLLADLGLDELAEEEMEILEDEADPRDLLALKGLLLCRQGEQRTGLIVLREAFPALGGPYQSSVPLEILHAYYPLEHTDDIRAQAAATGLPGSLIAGIIRQESAFDPRATSPVGARGLMQLMPATAAEMSRKVGIPYDPSRLYSPEVSIRLGSYYFREVLDGFDGNVELALAGYNGGPNRIRRLWKEEGEDPSLDDFLENLYLDESRNYVKRILVLADSYRQLYPELG
jgi:soluble lytic murein transglycosylase-like protein